MKLKFTKIVKPTLTFWLASHDYSVSLVHGLGRLPQIFLSHSDDSQHYMVSGTELTPPLYFSTLEEAQESMNSMFVLMEDPADKITVAALHAPEKAKPGPKPTGKALSNSERQKRHRDRQAAKIAQLERLLSNPTLTIQDVLDSDALADS